MSSPAGVTGATRTAGVGGGLYAAAWPAAAAFGTYFSMYAFRKPFTAATFADSEFADMTFKSILVIAQTLGYTASKFVGIKVVSEMPPHRRAAAILVLLGLAEVALVGFGMAPRPWNAFFLFCNGLPLGMVFGLVLGFLEGRRMTEALVAGLCASFILADGFMKSLGRWLLDQNVPEDWMPSVAGLIFTLPLLFFVWMLRRIPPPSAIDQAERSHRPAMTSVERAFLFRRYGIGLSALVVIFLLVTILRSIRADFSPEIWAGLGVSATPSTFTYSEIWVAIGVLISNAGLSGIRNSRWAFFGSLALAAAGMMLLVVGIIGQRGGWIPPFAFMVLLGLGLYIPYVVFHTTVFERFLAMTRERGNLGFLMQVADAVGYLGVVAVMFASNFSPRRQDFLSFFIGVSNVTIGVSLVGFLISVWYFATRRAPAKEWAAS